MKVRAPQPLRTAIRVLVFQDGLSSRNFEIPLAWLSRLGWLIAALFLVTILALSAAFHSWQSSRRAQPERLRELENQLQVVTQAAEDAAAAKSASNSGLIPSTCTLPAPAVAASPPSTPAPAPAKAPPAPCTPVAPAPAPASGASAKVVAFSTFTPTIVDEVSAVARPSVPLAIDAPTIRWDGRKLGMKFNLRFTGKEGENQQGHIVVLARGPDTLLAYPSGVIGGIDSRALLDPAQGEFFSVSRFRETRVEFPAVSSKIVSLEVLLFGTDRLDGKRKLLVREVLKVPPREGDRP